jgi:hypothetical protein
MKAKCSTRKREHSLNDKSEKLECSWQGKTECVFSKRNLLGSNHLLQQTKQNKTESESKDAPRKMHSIWSNKNIVSWKVTWFLPMKKGCLGASPCFDACTYWIFLGVTWASPSLSFSPYFISSHHSPFPTLENFLHIELHTILLAALV